MTYTNISTITRDAKQRLRWMEHLRKYRSARLTCRHFSISPDTLYLWKRRYDPNNLTTLEDDKKNRRPKALRKPTYTFEEIEEVKKLKLENPRVGKVLITKILKDKGFKLSTATVGRILASPNVKSEIQNTKL